MKCNKCNNEATTHLHQNINGEVTEAWLCSECAEKIGVGGMFSGFGGFGSFGNLSGFAGFDSLLGGFFGGTAPVKSLPQQTRCATCGLSMNDIIKRGKIGCADCYQIFENQLRPTIDRIHGRCSHVGKMPGKSAPAAQNRNINQVKPDNKNNEKVTIESLKIELKKAVANEEYEKAAQLRDQIRAMEG